MSSAHVAHMLTDLRARLRAGEWESGVALPTWNDLEIRYGVARLTVRRVLAKLKDDGLIFADPTRGTFAAPHPPHRCRIAVVVPFPRDRRDKWIRFIRALGEGMESMRRPDGIHLDLVAGVTTGEPGVEGRRLIEDVRNGLVAGVVILNNPELLDFPARFDFQLPIVWLDGRGPVSSQSAPVLLDHQHLVQVALARVIALGRTRPAGIGTPYQPYEFLPIAARASGLAAKPFWWQTAPVDAQDGIGRIIRLLFDSDNAIHPDALVITDDNVVPAALAVVAEMGLIPGRDLDIIAHANFPDVTPTMLPVWRVGWHRQHVLNACIDAVQRLAAGEGDVEIRVPAMEMAPGAI